MGIFDALNTSVAGLQAQSYALQNISGNIANSQTIGFKRIDTSFLDLIPDTAVNSQLAGSVIAHSRETNSTRGDIGPAQIATFMAISGNGFFTVQKPTSFVGNQPVFSGVNNYTRRGDFSLDKDGFLVNGAGYYIEGVPINPVTNSPSGSVPQVLKFASSFLPAQPTQTIQYQANLASNPLTGSANPATPKSELLGGPLGTAFPAHPQPGQHPGGHWHCAGTRCGHISLVTPSAAARSLRSTFRALRSMSSCAGPRLITANSRSLAPIHWNLFYEVNPTAAGAATAWQNVSTGFQVRSQRSADPSWRSLA